MPPSAHILALATAVPRYSITQDDAAPIAATFHSLDEAGALRLRSLYRRTQVDRRGSVVLDSDSELPRQTFFPPAQDLEDDGPTTADRMERYRVESAELAVSAATKAIAQAHLSPAEITHLVTVTCTGFAAPGFDYAICDRLPLSAEVMRTQVGFMGCHGAINGLRVAQALAADAGATVLVAAVELCSLHFAYRGAFDQLIANALFADGAAAIVLRGGAPSINGQSAPPLRLVATASCRFPDSADDMSWRIGNHGFQMTLSARVPQKIGEHLRPWIDDWLASHGLSVEAIGSWAIHPGGPRIVSAVGETLQLSPEDLAPSSAILAEHGNMSSPTLLFILERLRAQSARRPIVAIGFGPGLVAEVALLA